MDPVTGAALVTAAGSLASGLINRWKDKKDQKEMLQYQNNMNVSNWSMQNQYNSPAAQMQRLKDAGLNPNLIYQQGGATSQAGEIAAPSQTNFSEPLISANPFGMYMDLMSNQIEKGRLENETKNVESQVAYQRALRSMTRRETEILEKELGFKDKFLSQQVKMNEYKMLVDMQTANHLQSQTGLTQRDIDSYYIRLQNTLDNDIVNRALGRENIHYIQKKIDEINAVIKKTNNESALLRLQYARGLIAKSVEALAADIEKDKYYWLNNDVFPEKQRQKSNLWKKLETEIELAQAETLGRNISNITNPIRDLAIPIGLFLMSRGKSTKPIGFIQGYKK